MLAQQGKEGHAELVKEFRILDGVAEVLTLILDGQDAAASNGCAALQARFAAAEALLDSLPGGDMTREEQLREGSRLLLELEKKRGLVEKHRNHPLFVEMLAANDGKDSGVDAAAAAAAAAAGSTQQLLHVALDENCADTKDVAAERSEDASNGGVVEVVDGPSSTTNMDGMMMMMMMPTTTADGGVLDEKVGGGGGGQEAGHLANKEDGVVFKTDDLIVSEGMVVMNGMQEEEEGERSEGAAVVVAVGGGGIVEGSDEVFLGGGGGGSSSLSVDAAVIGQLANEALDLGADNFEGSLSDDMMDGF